MGKEIDFSKVIKGSENLPSQNPFDTAPAKSTMLRVTKGLDDIEKKAAALVVDSPASAVICTEMMGQIATVRKDLKRGWDGIVYEAKAFTGAVRNLFQPSDKRLERMLKGLKAKFGNYETERLLDKRKKEKAAQDEHKKRQARLLAAAKAGGVSTKNLVLDKPVMKKKPAAVRTDSGSASAKFNLVPEVVDVSKLPREYLVPDEKAIKAAVKAGLTDKKWWAERGVDLVEKPKVSIRT